jgi:hypothetical protein
VGVLSGFEILFALGLKYTEGFFELIFMLWVRWVSGVIWKGAS